MGSHGERQLLQEYLQHDQKTSINIANDFDAIRETFQTLLSANRNIAVYNLMQERRNRHLHRPTEVGSSDSTE